MINAVGDPKMSIAVFVNNCLRFVERSEFDIGIFGRRYVKIGKQISLVSAKIGNCGKLDAYIGNLAEQSLKLRFSALEIIEYADTRARCLGDINVCLIG